MRRERRGKEKYYCTETAGMGVGMLNILHHIHPK